MPLETSEAVALLHGLCVRRGRRDVLHEVNLEVPAGAITAVIGPNGAGKTTLLSALCGFLRPVAGSVSVLGQDIAGLGGRELNRLRRRIGLLPQLSAVNETLPLSVREVVEIGRAGRIGPGRGPGPADREAVDRAIEALGLSALAAKPYIELSGGERRKAQLARVLAQEPELILLDEPMANLDANWIARLRREIGLTWRRSRAAVIMVAHEIHHLPESTARVVLMSGGRVDASGRPEEILCDGVLARAYGEGTRVIASGGRYYLEGD